MAEKKRSLTLLDVTCLGVNAIIGSGIYFFPGKMAHLLGPTSILVFLITGVLLISVGLCYAEASTYYDVTGGPYLYAKQSFGDWAGFGIGWMTWISQMFSWAAVASAIAGYLGYFGDQYSNPVLTKSIAAAVIITMSGLNYRGVKLGARTANFFTAAKLIPLSLFILIGLPHISRSNFMPFSPHGWGLDGWRGMGRACSYAFFAFQGFEYIPVPAGELERPARNVPIALISALLLASGIYMLIQTTAVGVFPGLESAKRPLAEAALQMVGSGGAVFMVVGALLSTTGYNASVALVTPRYLVAIAADDQVPQKLAQDHPVYGTPYLSVVITAGITLFMAVCLNFDKLVDFTNIAVCIQYAAVCLSVPLLRKSRQAPAESLRLPGGWFLPIFGCLATIALGIAGPFFEDPASALPQLAWSGILLAAGFVLKVAFKARPLGTPASIS